MGFLLPVKGRSARNVSQTSMALKFLLDIGGLLQMGMTALWLEVLGGRRFRQRRQRGFLDGGGGRSERRLNIGFARKGRPGVRGRPRRWVLWRLEGWV